MAHNQTWQFLPHYLKAALLAQAISLAEAAELWDVILLSRDEWVTVPPRLRSAVERMQLLAVQINPTLH